MSHSQSQKYKFYHMHPKFNKHIFYKMQFTPEIYTLFRC